ncbi:MAG TPA: hypothetical protein VFP92_10815 [Rhodanobacteraceae bacterium]|nr:hypothetical protein [Rhodanobacteraceae bacterium]
MPFRVIEGTPPPDTPMERERKRIRAMPKPAAMVQCHRCGGREVVETKIGVMSRDGKASGGTKQRLCVACLMRGERVVV